MDTSVTMLKHLISYIFSFKGLYVAFVIAVVFYGQLRLMFGLTPRHIAIVAMLIACMRQDILFPMGRIMKTYFVFILTYLVSATITGYIGDVLITYYIAACIGFWATKILVVKYNDGKLLLNTIIFLGVLNALVTIGQTFNLRFSDQLVSFFHVKLPDKYLELNEEGGGDQFLLMTRPGLLANVVYNGYFLLTAGVASLLLLVNRFKLLKLIPWLVTLGGCICVQERGPIIILVAVSVLAFYKIPIIKKRRYALFFLLFIFIVQFIAGSMGSLFSVSEIDRMDSYRTFTIDEEDEYESNTWNNYSQFAKESRLADEGFNDPGRERIYRLTIDYLMDHPIIGGLQRLHAMYDIYPHNLFLLAFCYGGIVGGVAIILILFWQIKPLWRVIRRKIVDTNPVCFFAALAYVAYTLNSLVHNRSIVTGDEAIWMLWGLFYFEYLKFYKQDTRL